MLSTIRRFELKEEHIKILTNSNVYWNESYYGAAGIYPKRPYGNSNVSKDLANIIGEVFDEDSTEQHVRMNELHKETEIALQIILDTKSFVPGLYELVNYGKWEMISTTNSIMPPVPAPPASRLLKEGEEPPKPKNN